MSIQPIIIPISKGKLVKLLIFSIIFVVAGTFILNIEPSSRRSLMNIAFIRYSVAFSAIIMGAVGLIFFIIKIFDKKPGLVIDSKGITDNASGVSAGFIPWEDIRHIYTTQVMSEKFVLIGVSDPEKYINRQTNFLKRKAMSFNNKTYGSPISITSNGLKADQDELLTTLNEMWGKFKGTSE
ncbi:STM3941 family protein [Flavobacterium sp.]|uniref:STM3941 family protein n=1 Tax=Flavobacterium sp. TaxID=239 RepID=UPI0040346546